MKGIRVRSKVWLEVDGTPFLGDGRERLLRLIFSTGSISAAAREMGISYRRAWAQLESMEKLLSYPLATREKGGARKGETVLTTEALRLLERFDTLKKGVREFVDDKFEEFH